jgi:hypothetical protein
MSTEIVIFSYIYDITFLGNIQNHELCNVRSEDNMKIKMYSHSEFLLYINNKKDGAHKILQNFI